ncbi:MAG: TerB family tellurite resistance protein [Verrucomicrobia bacterium]|nr:TerB family tellurite resistance protein [Verrucomicrobiota bacterium]
MPTSPPIPSALPVPGETGNRPVDYHALRFLRDEHFYSLIHPQLEEAKRDDIKLEEKLESEEEKFFHFLSQAIDIEGVGNMPAVVAQVNANLGNTLPFRVFLTEFATARAMCIPRLSLREKAELDELIVVVSQHFVNDLDEAEQASVLGHELGHALLGHSTVPSQAIFNGSIELPGLPELRLMTLRWSVCAEVSCDLFGYVASGRDARSCQSALLKFTTGINSATLARLNPDRVISQVLGQYDTLATSVVKEVISTHPLTPLRIKLLAVMKDVELFRHFGEVKEAAEVNALRQQLNETINPLMRKIYPDLFEEERLDEGFILFYLAVATALADGKMDREELAAMNKMIRPDLQTDSFFEGLEAAMKQRDASSVVEELTERAVTEAKEKRYTKEEAARVAKLMLVIAAADGRVDSKELKVVHQFGRHFGLTKREVVYLANQVNTGPA